MWALLALLWAGALAKDDLFILLEESRLHKCRGGLLPGFLVS